MTPLTWFGLGFLCGAVVAVILWFCRTAYGCLHIDRSNPEKDVYRLDVGDLDRLSKKKQIIVKIDIDADLSQK